MYKMDLIIRELIDNVVDYIDFGEVNLSDNGENNFILFVELDNSDDLSTIVDYIKDYGFVRDTSTDDFILTDGTQSVEILLDGYDWFSAMYD